MKKTPIFILEEHHEAFFVWHYSAINKLIDRSNNVLLHVDEHSDMGVPNFNYSIKSTDNNIKNIYEFTYNELNIANFIIPTIYQGMFNRLYWLYQSTNEGRGSKNQITVYSHNHEGKVLTVDKNNYDLGTLAFFNRDLKNSFFQTITVTDEISSQNQSLVLDIDLDYFSCNPKSYYYQGKLEVTKEQYIVFNQNKHHFLRCCMGSGITSKIEDGKHYLFFNSLEPQFFPSKLKVSKQEILHRIELFTSFLQQNNLVPQVINICRSRLSGFTPKDQWQFIEESLINKLSSLYSTETIHVEEIIAQEKLGAITK